MPTPPPPRARFRDRLHSPHRPPSSATPSWMLVLGSVFALLAGGWTLLGMCAAALVNIPIAVILVPTVLLLFPALGLFAADMIEQRRRQ